MPGAQLFLENQIADLVARQLCKGGLLDTGRAYFACLPKKHSHAELITTHDRVFVNVLFLRIVHSHQSLDRLHHALRVPD